MLSTRVYNTIIQKTAAREQQLESARGTSDIPTDNKRHFH